MFVSNIMSSCVVECTEDTRLDEVFELIRKCDHGIVVVVDSLVHRVPIGVVSERSMCEQIIARGRNPRNLVAGSVMDSRIKKVTKDVVLEGLDAQAVAAVVVVDDNRQVCGLVPKEKIKAATSSGRSYKPAVPVVANAPQPPLRRISEIPAFGLA
jgi:predicted transcriptional regulator